MFSEAHETAGKITRGHATEYDSLELGGGGRTPTATVRGVVTTRPCSAC